MLLSDLIRKASFGSEQWWMQKLMAAQATGNEWQLDAHP